MWALFLQLKVSDEDNHKIESINLNSIKMQFLYRWYNTHAEILRDDIQLGYTSNPIYGLAK